MAVRRLPFHQGADFVVLDREIDISGHVEIGVSVIINISPGAARAPHSGSDASHAGYIGKCSVSIVVIELVAPNRGDVEIGPSIVVEVRRAGPHAKAENLDARRLCRILKHTASDVPKKAVPGPGRPPGIFEGTSVNQKNVEPSIVVVVEKQTTGPHGFGQVFLGGRSILVPEMD